MFTKELFLWIHVVLACFWVGGMIFLSLVIVPYIKDKPFRSEAFKEVGERFSLYGTIGTLSLLLITGIINSYTVHGGVYKRSIIEKIALFSVIVLVSLVHDLWAGKKALISPKHRNIAKYLGIINLLLSLGAVYLGVRIRLGM